MADVIPLITKYRPTDFSEVVGQDSVVRALEASVESGNCQTYLLVGPSGCGKTTLARITAQSLGVKPTEIQEMDSATYSGVDNVRALTSTLQYRALGPSGKRAIILDEVHSLSKSAWQSLLKILEEPPEHVYWFLCTTEEGKVPQTIKTRALCASVKPVSKTVLTDLLGYIADAEDMKVPDSVLRVCVSEAGGSPRQAISNLVLCSSADSAEEASDLLQSATESPEAVDLARSLLKGTNWRSAIELLARMKDQNPESIRQVVRAYITTVLLSTKDERAALRGLAILEQFGNPFPSGDGISPVVLAIGRLVVR